MNDGFLSLNFASSSNRPKVSAIEVLGLGDFMLEPMADAGSDIVVTANASGNAAVTLDGTGSMDLDGTITSYIWRQGSSIVASGANPTINLGIGSYTFELTVTDNDNQTDTDFVNVEVKPLPVVSSSVRINSGGSQTIAFGETFSQDQYFTGAGKPFKNPNLNDFPGDADDLYLFERTATANDAVMGYNVPLSNGTYLVRLHFAETWFGVSATGGVGKRVFSVSAEGNPVPAWNNIDIISQVGSLAPLVLEAEVVVSDGELNLQFTSSSNRSKINGIEILELVLPGEAAPSELISERIQQEVIFNISPNPANHYITMHLSGGDDRDERVAMRILNMSGRLILEQSFDANDFDGRQIDISGLTSGGYIIQVFKGDLQINRKFIKK